MKTGKDIHDHRYKNFYDVFDEKSDVYGKKIKISERPYIKDEDTMETERNLQDVIIAFEERDHNVFSQFDHDVTWNNNDYHMKADFFYRRKTQKLCQGTVSSISLMVGFMVGPIRIWASVSMKLNKKCPMFSASIILYLLLQKCKLCYDYFQFQRPSRLDIELKCACIHHQNPYLKLAPLKFEQKHSDPEIALIHDFAGAEEIERVKNLAKGKMRSTPYQVGKNFVQYSKLRTSKVMYQNETLVEDIMPISNRIEWLTQLKLKNELFASENFQLMNYGIGGKISPHVDATGEIYNKNSTRKFTPTESV